MSIPTLTSWLLSVVRVVGSTVVGKHSAVLVGGDGAVGAMAEDDPLQGEKIDDAEMYSALGLVVRPRPPETFDGDELAAEAMALRTGGGLIPIAWRDLRLNRRFSAPKAGSVALVGYGGGFLAFDDNAAKESVCTLYVPYAFNGAGVPTKAHTITVDPTGNAISLLHGDGGQFVLLPNKEMMAISNNSTWWKMKPGAFEVQADAINLIGTVSVGNPTLAVALLAGNLSQPSTRLKITTP